MVTKSVVHCDGCDKQFSSVKEIFHPFACETIDWFDYDKGSFTIPPVDLCETCARNLFHIMKKIADRLEEK